jgi:hypothetical protein
MAAGSGALTAAMALGAVIPGGQMIAGALALGATIADLVGGTFMDPRTARSNQIANLLGMSQYLKPAQIDLTTALSGGLAAETKGGGVSATGISTSNLQITTPSLVMSGQAPWYSLTGKPTAGIITPGGAVPFSGLGASIPGGQQYQYAQIPGQVLYGNLPANPNQATYTTNLNVNALDSQNILDRSEDISAAVQKELMLGNGMSMSLQNAMFGPQ